ncbi:MAG: dipeptidase [Thermoflexales bacterium]|nr:dipeptidase [Thermoflexales bacterium]
MSWSSYLSAHRDRFISEHLAFDRIPSISSLPQHKDDVRAAAAWAVRRMQQAGLANAGILETEGHPCAYAEWLGAPGAPTLLFYGHFDVQPVDPVSLWTTPPFEPTIRDGRIYARGATDDKAGVLSLIQAIESVLVSEGRLPVNVKLLFEGEEEIGSPNLRALLAARKAQLACDHIISVDGGQWSEKDGGILVSLKGLCGLQINVHGAATDLHSGVFGGAVANPLAALAHILAALRDPDGRVLVDGFYDDVVPLTPAERAAMAEVPFDGDELRDRVKVSALAGEKGYTPIERMWARPTLDVNGMWGGFQGAGVKTVLPGEAHAKITCRLVANQDPQKIIERIIAHVRRVTPPGVRVDFEPSKGTAYPYSMPLDHPVNEAIKRTLTQVYGKPPYYIRMGGSVPVTGQFERELGSKVATLAFGLDDEQMHAPDEFWRLSSLDKALKAYALFLHETF